MLTLEVRHLLQEFICHPPLILKALAEDRCQDQQLLPTTRVVHIIHRLLLHMLTLEVGHLLQELIRHSPLIISRRLLHMPSQRVAATKVPLTISRHLLRISPLVLVLQAGEPPQVGPVVGGLHNGWQPPS